MTDTTDQHDGRPRVAIVPSTDVFEDHFGRGLGLRRADLGTKYRNDFLFLYSGILERQGWAVDLVLLSTQVREPERHRYASAPDVVFLPVPKVAGALLPLRRGPLRFLVSFLLTWWGVAAALPGYRSVYCQEFDSGRFLALTLLCRRQGIGLVGAHHGGALTAGRARLLRAVEPWRGPLVVTALTRAETARVQALLGARASVHHLPNPVEDVFLAVEDAPTRTGTVFLGRLFDDQKRLSDLLRALAGLPAESWSPLTVVGDGPDRAVLEALTDELGLREHVHFRGFVYDRQQLRELLAGASVHAMPSAYEGAPLAVLETQAAGVLPLVSDLPAFRECVAPGTSFTRPGDVEGLRAALAALHDCPEHERGARRSTHRRFVRDGFSERAAGAALDALLRA